MIAPQAAGRRNEIARMLALGAGQPRQQGPSPGFTYPTEPMPVPQAVPYKEAGFGYDANRLTPMEELGMAARRRLA